ncbi:MAG: ShlB/FhaC/HecB family hemolysin secretion/activation protein [Neisseria sp.]|nr:ShlB/FhaC/HecB family hemolysin secretion/activation protein [Neisseria sp.]
MLPLYAAPLPPHVTQESQQLQQDHLLRDRQRQQELQQQMLPESDVRLDGSITEPPVVFSLQQAETPCFAVHEIVLEGDAADSFQFVLNQAITRSGFTSGMCLGAQGINHIMTLAQNAVIERGYTTTRILAAPQDLKNGVLILTVIPGRIRQIRIDTGNAARTHADRIAVFQNEFPTAAGDILNLRHLEQGLENLKRIPTAEADIQIVPAEDTPNASDVVILWKQRLLPYRLSLSVDDSGSKSTGKYQGGITFSADNPLGLSDLFYVSYNHDLGHKADHTDKDGKRTDSGTTGYAAHYSVPFGHWLWSWNHNYYRYHQAVAGDSENYDYNGKSWNSDIGVSRLLYRDAQRKTHLAAKLWQREAHSYINDAEIKVQRRRTAGWALNLTHKEYIGNATLDVGVGYKRGTGMRNSLRAPEEAFGEGTSRMQVITADLGLNLPFQIGAQHFSYDSTVRAQWNKTPLTPLDKIAIGGRYSVRGFDGETTLSAERGWYWRNDLAWQYQAGHQAYLGLDGGHVSGASARHLVGQSLIGGVIGARGQFKVGGNLHYDVFIGKPLKKPTHFRTANTAYGFGLNYTF